MDNQRLLIGLACFVGSLMVLRIGLVTILGSVPAHSDMRAAWVELTLTQKLFVTGCFVASAYAAGMVSNELVKLMKR